MKDELINELRRAIGDRDRLRIGRAQLRAEMVELKIRGRELDDKIAKHEATVEAIQHELLTGDSGLPIFDAAKTAKLHEPPGPRPPTDFFGKRQRGAKV